MVVPRTALVLSILVFTPTACTVEEEVYDGLFSPAEMDVLRTLSPLPPLEPDTTNAFADDERAAIFGQRLFYDPGYSGPIVVGDDGANGGLGAPGETGKVSCASCHLPDDAFIDTRSNPDNTSLAIDWYSRNSPSLVNVGTYGKQFGWSGFNDNLWGKSLIPAEFVMGTDRSGIVHWLFRAHRDEYDAIFEPDLDPALDPDHPEGARFPPSGTPLAPDGPWSQMAPADRDIVNRAYANFGKALAAFQRRLISDDAPFDRYVAGEASAIGEQAKRGLKLFIGKAGCVACHAGPTFSDEEYHVTGVPQIGEHVPPEDLGRYSAIPIYLSWDFNTAGPYSDDPSEDRTEGVTQDEPLRGAFRTKGLRNVGETAPYLHTGHLRTLEEVVELYNHGGAGEGFAGVKDPKIVPLNLTSQEVGDLVAFLETLTGQPIPEHLRRPPPAP